MFKLSLFLLLGFMSVVAQTTNNNFNSYATAGNDSLVDIFPLAIGNQWVYSYSWSTITDGFGTYHDTGTVTIQIVGKIIATDTLRWLMQETSHLWMNHDTGAFSVLTTSIDTVELIELQQGQHRLYINGDINKITSSVFSFLPNVDTIVCRYSTVNTAGIRSFNSRNVRGKGVFTYSFKQGIGLSSARVFDGCTCMDGFSGYHILRSQEITGVTNKQELLWNHQLSQNYPNPFNSSTTISFRIPSRSYVSLKIFDCIGREIETLVAEELLAGSHQRQWNVFNMSSGVYFYRLQSGSFVESKKLILLK